MKTRPSRTILVPRCNAGWAVRRPSLIGAILFAYLAPPQGFAQEGTTSTRPAGRLAPLSLVRAEAGSKSLAHPESAVDGNPKTEFTFDWANGGASLIVDLGKPCVIEAVQITNGRSHPVNWISEISVGPDPNHLRPLLGRRVNLFRWQTGQVLNLPLVPSVGRYVQIGFSGGGANGSISEVEFFGRENLPERHLMCWSSDLQKDFLDKLDYLDRDLGVTDLWLDYVETAFPQSNNNSGLRMWEESGALAEFRKRGIRYWLAEHEAFTHMVNDPADLRDEARWLTTFRQMRQIYPKARALGFRGLVLDAEDYDGVSKAAQEKYKDAASHVDAWAFADEFGLSGMYYHRGLQFGRALKEVWDAPLLQVYEARLYAGKNDCIQGNYWWLKGIHESGIEIWIATERTYGAGKGEVENEYAEYCRRWFVQMPEYLPQVHQGYPFAARVLPGFAPWITRIGKPNYLPKYLDQQLEIARNCAMGYWIYNEGNSRAGDPRDVLDRSFCRQIGVTPEQYLDVFRRHPTCRTNRP